MYSSRLFSQKYLAKLFLRVLYVGSAYDHKGNTGLAGKTREYARMYGTAAQSVQTVVRKT